VAIFQKEIVGVFNFVSLLYRRQGVLWKFLQGYKSTSFICPMLDRFLNSVTLVKIWQSYCQSQRAGPEYLTINNL